MQSVLARFLQPTGLLVALVVVLALLMLVVTLWASAMPDPEPLLGPFRWLPDEPVA